MQPQGSTSSQPSFDSLSSSDSLFFSDSEQAEDDVDVFLTDSSSSVIISGAGGATTDGDRVSESPGFQWACDGFTDKEEEEESDRSESSGKGAHISVHEKDPTSQSPKSQGDLLFAQKCAELQGFVRPLLELLNGLKRGRFDRGLSSFQQSVAMDRIQRIVGVLQRPNIGGKYLNILLQVEMMLKLWFPEVPTHSVPAASSTAMSPAVSLQHTSSSTPPHKHRDQLHIPVKKRRLSWTGTDSPTPSPVLKCPRTSREEKKERQEEDNMESPPAPMASASRNPKDTASDSQLNEDTKVKDSDSEKKDKSSKYKSGQSSEPSLTWVHVAPILSPRKACPSHEGAIATVNNENQYATAVFLARNGGSPATQDSFISSTTPYKHQDNLKKPIQCQSQPAAEQQSDSDTLETCQGQNKPLQVTPKPLPGVCPTPVET